MSHWSASLTDEVLTAVQVLFLHDRIIETTGGAHGLRDEALLLAAVGRPTTGLSDRLLYSVEQAAVLMHSLIRNYPFDDGNKRTGLAAAGLLLRRRGWVMNHSQDDVEHMAVHVATIPIEIEDLADWLRQGCVPAD